jgi:hypothetical protein
LTFKPGQSGNPAGRKPGATNRLVLEARKIADKLTPAVIKKLGKDAALGDRLAASLFLRYTFPKARVVESGLQFDMPKLESASDVPAAIRSVLAAIANGSLSPTDGHALIHGFEAYSRSAVRDGHEQRLRALEEQLALREVEDEEGLDR